MSAEDHGVAQRIVTAAIIFGVGVVAIEAVLVIVLAARTGIFLWQLWAGPGWTPP